MVIVRPFSCGRVFAAPADTFGECLPFDFARLHLCLDGVRPEGSRQHDRRLAGIQAVQTLSRLNRPTPARTPPTCWTSSRAPRKCWPRSVDEIATDLCRRIEFSAGV